MRVRVDPGGDKDPYESVPSWSIILINSQDVIGLTDTCYCFVTELMKIGQFKFMKHLAAFISKCRCPGIGTIQSN